MRDTLRSGVDGGLRMTNTDLQLLVAQARSEADNPGYKVRGMCVD